MININETFPDKIHISQLDHGSSLQKRRKSDHEWKNMKLTSIRICFVRTKMLHTL